MKERGEESECGIMQASMCACVNDYVSVTKALRYLHIPHCRRGVIVDDELLLSPLSHNGQSEEIPSPHPPAHTPTQNTQPSGEREIGRGRERGREGEGKRAAKEEFIIDYDATTTVGDVKVS